MGNNSRAVKAEAERQTDPDKPVLIRETTVEFKGVEYTVNANAFDDVEILESLEDERYISVIRRVIGADKWSAFKDSVRTDDGRVPAKSFEEFMDAILSAVGPTGTP